MSDNDFATDTHNEALLSQTEAVGILSEESILGVMNDFFHACGGVENIREFTATISRIRVVLNHPLQFQESHLLTNDAVIGVLNRLSKDNMYYIVTKPYVAKLLGKELDKRISGESP